MTDTTTFTPAAPPTSPEAGLALLRTAFPANQVSLLPKNVRKAVQGEDRWQCVPGTADSRKASKDGRFCGGYHAASIHLDYVGHAAVTDRLLDADPGWTWEPVSWNSDGFPRFDAEGGLWIRLTVQGVTRLGYGDAQGKRGPNATKEAIGDAIRNAAMRFGVALDLWHKGDLHDPTEATPDGAASETVARDWAAEAANLTTFDAVRALWGEARAGGASAAVLDAIVERGNDLAEAERARDAQDAS